MQTRPPLQNRVAPNGQIHATPARGLFIGNRGGKIHSPKTKNLLNRRWSTRQWICCALSFKNRRREIMGNSYTELFFLDEVTALAAGHRPCFECRREQARLFAAAFAQPEGPLPRAADIDSVLHQERLEGKAKRLYKAKLSDLPDGVIVRPLDSRALLYPHAPPEENFFALRAGRLLLWSFNGYGAKLTRPLLEEVMVLTPPSITQALLRGYQPEWSPSAAL